MHIDFRHYVEQCGEFGYVWPDRTSLMVLFGSVPPHRQEWRTLLRQAYGSRVLLLGHQLFGRQLPLAVLPAIARQQNAIAARLAECAALAPLLVPFVQMDADIPADFAAIRTPALAKGLTPAGWRWLTYQSPGTVRTLLRFGWNEETIMWMNLLARARPNAPLSSRWLEAGRPFAMQRFSQQMANWSTKSREAAFAGLERYLRLLPADASIQRLTEHEHVLGELFILFQAQDFSLVKPQQSWQGLLRKVRDRVGGRIARAQEAAAAAADAAKEKTKQLAWPGIFGQQVVQGIRVTELTSAAALVEEGIIMSHCVGDGAYTDQCASGSFIILRLEHDATAARATLQLTGRNKAWHIGQLAGPGNASVPTVFWSCAKAVVKQLSI